MSVQSIHSEPKQNITSTPLQSAISNFGVARNTYDDLLERLEKVGHRLLNTDYPVQSTDKAKKDSEPKKEGLLTEIDNEANWFHIRNERLRELVCKFESLI